MAKNKKETENLKGIIRGFINNKQPIINNLATQNQDEISILLFACYNSISEHCYKIILEKQLINKIKTNILTTIKDKIVELQQQQLTMVLSSKLELYQAREQQEIDGLQQLLKKIEQCDFKEIIKNIIATLLNTNPMDMEQIQERKDTITKEKLQDLSYDGRPCINENKIDDNVIKKICEHIRNENLRDIVLKVEITLENDELFLNLRKIKQETEELVSEYYITIIEEKIEKIKEELESNNLVKKLIKKHKSSFFEIKKELEKKKSIFNKRKEKNEYLIQQIDTIIGLQEAKTEREKLKKSDLTDEQRKIYEGTCVYKEMMERKNEDGIERLEEIFVSRIKEEINQYAKKISNSITEVIVATKQEKEKIEEFANHLSIPVPRATKILANSDNIYLYLITTWLANEIKFEVKTPEYAFATLRDISPEQPKYGESLARVVMSKMGVPRGVQDLVANSDEINKIGIPNPTGKNQRIKYHKKRH